MKAMFVNDSEYPYAVEITMQLKTIETRSKNMLSALVGERVAIVRTYKGRAPLVVGYVDIVKASFENALFLDHHRYETLIPVGSKFDTGARWCYFLENATPCAPYPLPANAVRHGRSWCEF